MSAILLISGLLYGIYALCSLGIGIPEKELRNMNNDLRSEIERGGFKGNVCRAIHPVVWLLTLPFESLLSSLALAVALICAGSLL